VYTTRAGDATAIDNDAAAVDNDAAAVDNGATAADNGATAADRVRGRDQCGLLAIVGGDCEGESFTRDKIAGHHFSPFQRFREM
jgi:hypothetical protein